MNNANNADYDIGTVVYIRSFLNTHRIGDWIDTRFAVVHFNSQVLVDAYFAATGKWPSTMFEFKDMPDWYQSGRPEMCEAFGVTPVSKNKDIKKEESQTHANLTISSGHTKDGNTGKRKRANGSISTISKHGSNVYVERKKTKSKHTLSDEKKNPAQEENAKGYKGVEIFKSFSVGGFTYKKRV